MTTKPTKRVRCAVYTRVSTEYGLDQEFNSLDAQHEAAEAYIRSQAHDGWTLIRTRYDDGGYSGGSTDRPALQRLLADIRDHRIDIVVVYKVDRLTRSLADFAKLVELFDAHSVSFVSVTQQFNTTTSMGRLTLNVLLSFAQFEREVTSERIRDKIGASKRKGLWVGGMVPLGYVSRDKKLLIEREEAERVRTIFRRYLDLGSIGLLLPDLRERRIVTKVRHLSDGRTIGCISFTRGPLAYLLRNRFYIGEVVFKGQICPGEHPPILDRDLFEAVQLKLAEQHNGYRAARASRDALLTGRIFDDRGNRMSPSHSRKGSTRYGYYVSSALIQGQPQSAGSVIRVPAAKVEAIVLDAVRRHIEPDAPVDNTELITLYPADRGAANRNRHLAAKRRKCLRGREGRPARPHRAVEQDASSTPSRRHCPRRLITSWSPTDPLRHPEEARRRNRARTAMAVRDRGRLRDNRRHRRTAGLQHAPRQHDDLAGLPGTGPHQSRRRRSTATRDRRRSPVRRAGHMVAPASDARVRALTSRIPCILRQTSGPGPWRGQSWSGCDRWCGICTSRAVSAV
jgi:DNA invertase Pin-like site-specific DNA recombinase